jgi:hypothetical protein
MKLSELMAGKTPSATYEGISTADDFVLAIDFSGSATKPGDYLLAQEGIVEHSAALNPKTADSTYIRAGTATTKTGTARSFKLSGDIYAGDEFQDALLAHAIKYGTGQTVIKPYVYFNALTGKGEKGLISIAVEDDPSGEAGANAGFSATLTARGTPAEYTWSAE